MKLVTEVLEGFLRASAAKGENASSQTVDTIFGIVTEAIDLGATYLESRQDKGGMYKGGSGPRIAQTRWDRFGKLFQSALGSQGKIALLGQFPFASLTLKKRLQLTHFRGFGAKEVGPPALDEPRDGGRHLEVLTMRRFAILGLFVLFFSCSEPEEKGTYHYLVTNGHDFPIHVQIKGESRRIGPAQGEQFTFKVLSADIPTTLIARKVEGDKTVEIDDLDILQQELPDRCFVLCVVGEPSQWRLVDYTRLYSKQDLSNPIAGYRDPRSLTQLAKALKLKPVEKQVTVKKARLIIPQKPLPTTVRNNRKVVRVEKIPQEMTPIKLKEHFLRQELSR